MRASSRAPAGGTGLAFWAGMLVLAVMLALLVGLSLGLLGGGGSILTVPILRYVLGMDAHRAVALSLLVIGTTSLAALLPHARRGRVRWRTALVFGAAGMLGAFLAGRVAHFIPAVVLLVLFGLMMLVTAVAMLRGRGGVAPSTPRELPALEVLGEGLVVGAVTGLVGAGGGFLVVPALVLLGGLPIDVAVGTSLVVIAMKSFAGFVGFVGHTPVDWTLALSISAAAVVGSVAGGALADRISPARLRSGFGWFVVVMALFILGQEVPRACGLTPPVGLALALALLGTSLAAAAKHLGLAPRRGARGGRSSVPLA